MAAVIEAGYATGQTLYAMLRNKSRQIWNGSAFEAYDVTHRSLYVQPLTEQPSSEYYVATFPATIGAGLYTFWLYQQSGGSPVAGDEYIGSGSIYWDGVQEVPAWSTLDGDTVKAKIVEALRSDALSELAALPPSAPTMAAAIMLLYMAVRNKTVTTTTETRLFTDAGVLLAKAGVNDDGTQFQKNKFAAP